LVRRRCHIYRQDLASLTRHPDINRPALTNIQIRVEDERVLRTVLPGTAGVFFADAYNDARALLAAKRHGRYASDLFVLWTKGVAFVQRPIELERGQNVAVAMSVRDDDLLFGSRSATTIFAFKGSVTRKSLKQLR
jgi:hypothetical protein